MTYVETPDEIPIYYLDEGPRTSSGIFLIHAEPFSSSFWQKNIPDLSREFRVVAMDIRGRGQSGKTDDGHNMNQYGLDFRYMLEVLGLERVVVVGWSLGGSIAWSYMQKFGDERLAGYVNVDQRPFRYSTEEQLQELLTERRDRRLFHHMETIRVFLGPEAGEEEDVVKWMAYECMKTPTSANLAIFAESYRTDYRHFLPQVRIPTRIFWAKYGYITAEMAALMNEAMPNSRLVFFEHSGHLLPWTEPDKFNREVAEFSREVLATPTGA